MMDVYCRICTDAIDTGEFVFEAEASNRTIAEVSADFRTNGCVAFTGMPTTCEPDDSVDPEKAAMLEGVYEVCEYMDDAAMALEDFGFLRI